MYDIHTYNTHTYILAELPAILDSFSLTMPILQALL